MVAAPKPNPVPGAAVFAAGAPKFRPGAADVAAAPNPPNPAADVATAGGAPSAKPVEVGVLVAVGPKPKPAVDVAATAGGAPRVNADEVGATAAAGAPKPAVDALGAAPKGNPPWVGAAAPTGFGNPANVDGAAAGAPKPANPPPPKLILITLLAELAQFLSFLLLFRVRADMTQVFLFVSSNLLKGKWAERGKRECSKSE